jgi:uncharacterized protein (TIGR03435 family)
MTAGPPRNSLCSMKLILIVLLALQGFEVASIRENTSGEDRVSGGFLPGGLYRVVNYPLRSLIAAAYLRPQVNPGFLIEGGPDWMDTTRFDIEARAAAEFPAAPDGPNAPRRVMLQQLLADRFGLKVHHVTRQGDVYALTFAQADRRPGPAMKVSAGECSPCGLRIGPGSITGTGVTITQLMAPLPRFVDRVVIDSTGLTDRFDLTLKWTPAPGEWIAPPPPGSAFVPPSADGPSLFTALQEQLGLKLQAQKGPIDILVVDEARKPR